MNWKRIVRDAVILTAFSGAFYLVMVFVNRLDGSSGRDNIDFSYARKQADLLLKRRDWYRAATQFKKLTDKDPFDGRAWYIQGVCHDELRQRAVRDLQNATGPQATEDARKRVKELEDLAVEHYLISREFSRYRQSSLYQVAAIECGRGNFDKTIGYLQEFVDNGYFSKNGIAVDRTFGFGGQGYVIAPLHEIPESAKLHSDPRFWAIDRIEKSNAVSNQR